MNKKIDNLKTSDLDVKSELEIKNESFESGRDGVTCEDGTRQQDEVLGVYIEVSSPLKPFDEKSMKGDDVRKIEEGLKEKTENDLHTGCQQNCESIEKGNTPVTPSSVSKSAASTSMNVETLKSSNENRDLRKVGEIKQAKGDTDASLESNSSLEALFSCTLCRYKASNRRVFQDHLLLHSGSKMFSCSECDYETDRKGHLKAHLLDHSNIKMFTCPECDYEASRKGDLKTHLMTHLDMKSFKCTECDLEFIHKDSFKSHLSSHSNIKFFKCSECGYECNQQSNLRAHLLTHSDTKLFKCSQCSYETNRSESLKSHELSHSDVKLFKCSECSYECNRKNNFKRHVLNHKKA